ncbi:MAG: hydrogenase maturation nickel metallochaperone HypA [Bacteroidetes bacterium]|nr:MAG: hydrogenase maturation nickel metallochaperone HypA [Bacteroidota bacterium]
MHEVSLVRNIFRSLEDTFSPPELARLTAIDLTVGKLANVEPVLMQNAFDAVRQSQPEYAGVTLNIELLPILVDCPNCGSRFEVAQYRFVCSECQTPSNQVVQGTELLIRRVHFREEEGGA